MALAWLVSRALGRGALTTLLFGREQEEECLGCLESRRVIERRGGEEALDSVAMATLAQLSYAAWEQKQENVPALQPAWFQVCGTHRHDEKKKGKHDDSRDDSKKKKWSARFFWMVPPEGGLVFAVSEALRWARCVLREAAAPAGTRWPRPYASSPATVFEKRCDFLLKRRWELAWWLSGWHESNDEAVKLKWHSTHAVVGVRPSDGAIAVVFRGSADHKNTATNLQPLTRAIDEERRVPGRTLHGIRRAFACVDAGNSTPFLTSKRVTSDPSLLTIFAHLENTTNTTLADVLEATANAALDAKRTLFLAGHSLGAALAVQLAARLRPDDDDDDAFFFWGRQKNHFLRHFLRWPRKLPSSTSRHKKTTFQRPPPPKKSLLYPKQQRRDIRVFTFGEPAFGDSTFYAAHAHLAPVTRRFVSLSAPPLCAADVISNIASLFGAADHATPATFICDPRKPPGPITAHGMAAYVRGVRAATRHWLDLHVVVPPNLTPHLRPLVVLAPPQKKDNKTAPAAATKENHTSSSSPDSKKNATQSPPRTTS